MKKILLLLFCCSWFFTSCKSVDKTSVVIQGKGFDQWVRMVYLAEAGKWEDLLDSAACKDGKFTLNYKQLGFEPFKATVMYLDSNGKKQSFFVLNQIQIDEDGQNHANDAFMLDYGLTRLEYQKDKKSGAGQSLNSPIQVKIDAGREEALFQKYEHKNLGYIPKTGGARQKRFEALKDVIDDHSFSYYLLGNVFKSKLQYSKAELVALLDHFDEDVQQSKLAGRLKDHIASMLDVGESSRPLALESSLGIRKHNINRFADVNMLVFWASWCGPCRLEIPQLKQIHQTFKDKGFYMASISLDDNRSNWNTALSQEQMSWDQYILNQKEKDAIKAEYAFESIPLVVFTNKEGRSLGRFSGYSPAHIEEYIKVIEANLNK
jgi:thiol-disulfide isomerase/thioredoxin